MQVWILQKEGEAYDFRRQGLEDEARRTRKFSAHEYNQKEIRRNSYTLFAQEQTLGYEASNFLSSEESTMKTALTIAFIALAVAATAQQVQNLHTQCENAYYASAAGVT